MYNVILPDISGNVSQYARTILSKNGIIEKASVSPNKTSIKKKRGRQHITEDDKRK